MYLKKVSTEHLSHDTPFYSCVMYDFSYNSQSVGRHRIVFKWLKIVRNIFLKL